MGIQEKLNHFKSQIENGYYDDEKSKEVNLKIYEEIENYILGKSSQVPVIHIKDYDQYPLLNLPYLLSKEATLNAYDYRVMDIIIVSWQKRKKSSYDGLEESFVNVLNDILCSEQSGDDYAQEILSYIEKKGIGIDKIITLSVEKYIHYENYDSKTRTFYPNSMGRYVLSHFVKSPADILKIIHSALKGKGYLYYDKIVFLIRQKPKECAAYFNEIIDITGINQVVIAPLLEADIKTVLSVVQKKVLSTKPDEIDLGHNYSYFDVVDTILPYDNTVRDKIKSIILTYIEFIKQKSTSSRYFYDGYVSRAMNLLLNHYPDDFLPILTDYIHHVPYFSHSHILSQSITKYGHEAMAPVMLSALNKKAPKYALQDLFTVFNDNYDVERYSEYYWQIFEGKNNTLRNMLIPVLAKLEDKVIDKAVSYLSHKSGDMRKSSTLLLATIGTKTALEHIKTALEKETNEDTRDSMLQTIASKSRKKKYSEDEVQEIIQNTDKRKRLEKPVREWLKETDLPDIYWQNGKKLTEKEVRFILYRQSREKTMRPDVELKPILTLLDRSKSGKFAKAVFERFTQGKMDSKDKFCLSIAGLLGDDNVVDSIKAAIMEWTSGSRGKMAEYAVQALANVGSPKALRVIEFCSRKFANKQKNVGSAAREAFNDAAENLGITMYELEDMIVPDFDFGGTHKTFTIKDKQYNAFVDSNFTFVFVDEDNKRYKSLPKAASKELQDEFKQITKELKEIMKLQHQRMQNYMVAQRRWTVERWQTLFMNNPVLYPYTTSLVWGLYDREHHLVHSFIFDYEAFKNSEQEEITLPSDGYIGILHPMEISEKEREIWKNILEEYAMEPPFNQMFREVIILEDKDKDKKMYTGLANKKIDMYAFRSIVEKNGWTKGSVQDGGILASYYKPLLSVGIDVFMNIDGLSVDGYEYDDGVTVESVYFVKHGSVHTGSYVYDEPNDEKDKRLIPFEKVPSIVYSEIMMEIKNLENIAIDEDKEN